MSFLVSSFTEALCVLVLNPTTMVPDQINSDWDYLQANHMSSSFKTDNLICSF
jgi:hypothetical protein